MNFTSFEHKVKQLLSRREVSFFVVGLAIIVRAIQVLFFFNVIVDRTYQFIATDNFLRGNGFTLATVQASDLSITLYEPLIKWPPGFSVLVAPFYLLFNRNYIAAGIAIDITAAVGLILFSRKILSALSVQIWLINIYTLLTGAFIYEFYFFSSSDAIVVTLLVMALYYTIQLLKSQGEGIRTGLITGVLLLVTASLKYSIAPATFVIPLFLLLKGRSTRKAVLLRAGIISISILTIGLGSVLVYQKLISGSAVYYSKDVVGFFPENLLASYPFLTAAFIRGDTIGQLSGIPWDIGTLLYGLLLVIHVLLAILCTALVYQTFRNKGLKKTAVVEDFFYLFFLLSITIYFLLLFLSIRIEIDTQKWTYVQEARYYGILTMLTQFSFFVIIQHYQSYLAKALRYVLVLMALLLFLEVSRGIAFVCKRVNSFTKEEYSWQYEDRFQKYAHRIIEGAKQSLNVKKVVVTGTSYYYYTRISLFSHVPYIHEVQNINNIHLLSSKEPVLLLIFLHKKDLSLFQPFLADPNRKLAGQFDDFYFYTEYVRPR